MSETYAITTRRWMATALAADVAACGMLTRLVEAGCQIVKAGLTRRRLAYKQGWGVYYTRDWRIHWRDALGRETITTIERDGDEETEVSRAVELLAMRIEEGSGS